MNRIAALGAAVVVWAGCDRAGDHASGASCERDLGGVYTDLADDARRWIVVDRGARVEIYPLFADASRVGDLDSAPRFVDLRREGERVSGHVRRRYLRGAVVCEAQAVARITACADGEVRLVMADPAPPIASPDGCRYGHPADSRVVRWRHN